MSAVEFTHTITFSGDAYEWFINAMKDAVRNQLVVTIGGDKYVQLVEWMVPEADIYSVGENDPLLRVHPLTKNGDLTGEPFALTLLDLTTVEIL